MLTWLRRRTRGQLITLVAVLLCAAGASCCVLLAPGSRTAAPPDTAGFAAPSSTVVPTAPIIGRAPIVSPAPIISSAPAMRSAPLARMLPVTASADVYAAAVADALWNIDYATTSRDAVLAFWRAQLSPVLPAGTPPRTTLAQAQAAGLSTLTDLLPTAGMWSTLARDHTASSFTVTGVSEPPSWIEAVSNGEIIDPGLTAREVIGVQRISYGAGAERHTTAQSQELVVALLCPPTTVSCRVEVFPPRDSSGVSG